MNLKPCLRAPRMLASEKAMAEKMKVQEIEDVNLIQMDKREV